jgi:hypothetical protein
VIATGPVVVVVVEDVEVVDDVDEVDDDVDEVEEVDDVELELDDEVFDARSVVVLRAGDETLVPSRLRTVTYTGASDGHQPLLTLTMA